MTSHSTASIIIASLLAATTSVFAAEIHVAATGGNDASNGSVAQPLKTISAAAQKAQPGDLVTVHAGVYRECVDPPRGGESDRNRITYQAAPGEKAVITGAEPVKGWEKVSGDTWKVTLPAKFFGGYNPFADLIHGDYFISQGRPNHTGAVYLNGEWLSEVYKREDVLAPAANLGRWFATAPETFKDKPIDPDAPTTVFAQFKGVDPNQQNVEINVRPTVFSPAKTGINYITLRGFILRQAATQWAPPTAGQIGIVSAYWNKGWIIENNEISHSICAGVALGKYRDVGDNFAGNNSQVYVTTIEHALKNGWNKDTVGSHIVRNNHIHHCEQNAVVGSMGCAFSTIEGNVIHDIHVRRAFGGYEMAGIKFHGLIDGVIRDNHIYDTGCPGIWLDWMCQGTQVTGNLFHDNVQDIFLEMQHGPMLVANNLFLTPGESLFINSKGVAFAHNLIVGGTRIHQTDERVTPYHKPHSTEILGTHNAPGGDHRFHNNLLLNRANLAVFDQSPLPSFAAGNVYVKGVRAPKFDTSSLVKADHDPKLKLMKKTDGWYLALAEDAAWKTAVMRPLVTTQLLGNAKIPNLPYENANGSPLRVDSDYFGKMRDTANPFPGPFETPVNGEVKVWPK